MNLPLAPLAAAALGTVAALGVLVMPVGVLESLVMDSGIAAVVQAAEPPLGFTARAMLAGGAGGLAAVLGWFMAFIVVGTRSVSVGETTEPSAPHMPVIRRADAHPDAPPREPLLATRDLGTPFLEVRATANVEEAEDLAPAPQPMPEPLIEQPLPRDFNQPLAAFDPDSIPQVPRPKPVPLAPLRRTPRPAVFDESERFEVFELTPPVRPKPAPVAQMAMPAAPPVQPIVRPETDASVHALLERLERGVVRKGLATGMETEARPRDAERGLEDALVTLRNLARRA
ncbi:MAG: hypothetical protein KF730_04040 [Sphingomonas sp.]|uniref:hypothetical protein n=1 Tax=Sphingomonas sp. TaxID=28214 RepID=UPI0025F8E469|nr:hypothetical protein [Sphingomonas sp.]MBX3563730.1 hypothetical protein [Sphingomonas sp.]